MVLASFSLSVCVSFGLHLLQPNPKSCLGGWGGCYYYSQAVSTAANRAKFVSAIVSAVKTYNLDGQYLLCSFY